MTQTIDQAGRGVAREGTEIVTETLTSVREDTSSQGTEIVAVAGSFGAPLISHRAEEALVNHAILQAIAACYENCDGDLIGVPNDIALSTMVTT